MTGRRAARPETLGGRGLETVIDDTRSGAAIAWFAVRLFGIATHPSGRTWARLTSEWLVALFVLEGSPEPTTASDGKG